MDEVIARATREVSQYGYPLVILDSPDFQKRLAETIAWYRECTVTGDNKRDFRSPELDPGDVDDYPTPEWLRDAVDHVCRRREARLSALGRESLSSSSDLVGGRLLIYDPDGNLYDGAASVATGGFFDNNNVAPWDLWVTFVDERPTEARTTWSPFSCYLVVWIPPQFQALVADGIEVNPEECIAWADSAEGNTMFALSGARVNEVPVGIRWAIFGLILVLSLLTSIAVGPLFPDRCGPKPNAPDLELRWADCGSLQVVVDVLLYLACLYAWTVVAWVLLKLRAVRRIARIPDSLRSYRDK